MATIRDVYAGILTKLADNPELRMEGNHQAVLLDGFYTGKYEGERGGTFSHNGNTIIYRTLHEGKHGFFFIPGNDFGKRRASTLRTQAGKLSNRKRLVSQLEVTAHLETWPPNPQAKPGDSKRLAQSYGGKRKRRGSTLEEAED